jgi:hypothetical protein
VHGAGDCAQRIEAPVRLSHGTPAYTQDTREIGLHEPLPGNQAPSQNAADDVIDHLIGGRDLCIFALKSGNPFF